MHDLGLVADISSRPETATGNEPDEGRNRYRHRRRLRRFGGCSHRLQPKKSKKKKERKMHATQCSCTRAR